MADKTENQLANILTDLKFKREVFYVDADTTNDFYFKLLKIVVKYHKLVFVLKLFSYFDLWPSGN